MVRGECQSILLKRIARYHAELSLDMACRDRAIKTTRGGKSGVGFDVGSSAKGLPHMSVDLKGDDWIHLKVLTIHTQCSYCVTFTALRLPTDPLSLVASIADEEPALPSVEVILSHAYQKHQGILSPVKVNDVIRVHSSSLSFLDSTGTSHLFVTQYDRHE